MKWSSSSIQFELQYLQILSLRGIHSILPSEFFLLSKRPVSILRIWLLSLNLVKFCLLSKVSKRKYSSKEKEFLNLKYVFNLPLSCIYDNFILSQLLRKSYLMHFFSEVLNFCLLQFLLLLNQYLVYYNKK